MASQDQTGPKLIRHEAGRPSAVCHLGGGARDSQRVEQTFVVNSELVTCIYIGNKPLNGSLCHTIFTSAAP